MGRILHIVSHYGYTGIFGLLMFGLLGIPVPDEFLMTLSGYLVKIHQLHYIWTILTAIAGSMFGMTISFSVGRYLGLPFLHRFGKRIGLTMERYEKVEAWFERFGKRTIIFGYFVPGVRQVTAIYAGISRWSYGTFFLYALTGSIIWVMVFVNLGIFFGEHWKEYTLLLHKSIFWLILVIILIGFVVWMIKKRKHT
ncbi:DedA family protein [Shimazuella sp. AN120528]|uniref:DedA family protein n=1 Tax=Shimazuella soli TaxID=1892854 RepID=UPI001F1086CE|nr:DedA family protein [Shimazuella soli]MCH5584232.1 DedA family protein [Shimazuella soli]